MIQDKNKYYALLKFYVDFMFKLAYRRVEYYGKENIPQNGAIIYAPNHTNTLMDALAVLAIDSKAKVFVARADVFKNPVIKKILTFFKMLPIHRKRDGADNLIKNEEINELVVNVLHDKVPFCILPEGTHRPMHSLMPLKKGVFRIAMQANDTFGNETPVYIIPVGIEYGHFFRFRSSLLVQIGEPINVTEFIKENPELNIVQHINELQNELCESIKSKILYIPDDENYNAVLQLAQMNLNLQISSEKLSSKNKLLNRFSAAKENIKNIENSLQSASQKTQEILKNAEEFSQRRYALGIGMNSVLKKNIRLSVFGKILLLLLGFPYFIFCAAATSPVTLLSMWLCSKFKDNTFHNSVRFLIAFALLPVILIAGIIVFSIFSWKLGIIFALLFIPSFLFLHEYLRLIRLFISDVKWLKYRNIIFNYKKFIL